jgi:redox-sensitive bicupin YhaK (pirin superfamily)
MIIVRTDRDRRHYRGHRREVWHTFHSADPENQFAGGFHTLEFLDEERLPPGAVLPRCHRQDAELVTFVTQGALECEDSMGCASVIRAGELQHVSASRCVHRAVRNASQTDWAHVFRIWLRPTGGSREPGCGQRLFTAADRRNRLLVVASPDAREGALRVRQDVQIHSALMDPGYHLVHEMLPGRGAWIHVLEGSVKVGDVVLTAGDGAGVTGARAVALTAREPSSILLVDVGERPPEQPGLSGTALFGMLWEGTAEVLGPSATATILRRAARRALPRSPELVGLDISRAAGEFRYSLPRSFEQAGEPPAPMRHLLEELRPLLAELTGQAVLRRLERVPQLREWANIGG